MPAPSTTGGGLMSYASTVDAGVITPAIIATDAAISGGITTTCTINVPFLYAFEVPQGQTWIIHQVRWHMGATTTGHTNMAIYTAAGNLVAGSDTGSIVNSANTTQTPAYGTDVLLGAGQYYMALASDNGTDTYAGHGTLANLSPISRYRIGTNLLSGGAMPATLGAIVNNPSSTPFMALIPTGSLIT